MGRKLTDMLQTLPKEKLISWVRSFAGSLIIDKYPEWPNYDEEFYEVLKKEYEEGLKERIKRGDRSQIMPGEDPEFYKGYTTQIKKRDNYVKSV